MDKNGVFGIALLAILLYSCSTDPDLDERDGRWKFHDLDSAAVHSIHERNGKLHAGTDQGVYVSTGTERASWKDPKLNIYHLLWVITKK